jgi:hypothetical protein
MLLGRNVESERNKIAACRLTMLVLKRVSASLAHVTVSDGIVVFCRPPTSEKTVGLLKITPHCHVFRRCHFAKLRRITT